LVGQKPSKLVDGVLEGRQALARLNDAISSFRLIRKSDNCCHRIFVVVGPPRCEKLLHDGSIMAVGPLQTNSTVQVSFAGVTATWLVFQTVGKEAR
jgi:hypothetical protein